MVRPESEFVKVPIGVFRANVDMGRGDRFFEQLPEAFDAIGVMHSIMAIVIVAPFLRTMLDHAVLVTIAG